MIPSSSCFSFLRSHENFFHSSIFWHCVPQTAFSTTIRTELTVQKPWRFKRNKNLNTCKNCISLRKKKKRRWMGNVFEFQEKREREHRKEFQASLDCVWKGIGWAHKSESHSLVQGKFTVIALFSASDFSQMFIISTYVLLIPYK